MDENVLNPTKASEAPNPAKVNVLTTISCVAKDFEAYSEVTSCFGMTEQIKTQFPGKYAMFPLAHWYDIPYAP